MAELITPWLVALNVSLAADLTVSASTVGSSDPDGSISQTMIDFGDGTVVQGATATHKYSAVGAYTVTATVVDSRFCFHPVDRNCRCTPVTRLTELVEFTDATMGVGQFTVAEFDGLKIVTPGADRAGRQQGQQGEVGGLKLQIASFSTGTFTSVTSGH